jgi:tetratricopeptide (TPR) repeat protein
MLAAVLAENPGREAEVEREVDDERYAVCERNPTAAARVIAGLPREGVVYNGVNFPYAYLKGFVLRCQGDDAAARVAFAEARETVEKTVAEKPNLASALSLLGLIDAGLGRKDDAIREGRRACDMLPASKDAVDGVDLEVYLAQIYTWVGEKDSAIAQIKEVQRKPNYLSHGLLKLSPIWDPLRGDPRFEKIVQSLAPK